MTNINIDFNKYTGKIKPMNAVNNGPRQVGARLSRDLTKEYMEMNIPFSRLHDTEAPYGANQFVDIHCIFPDFSKDVEDENSYNFKCTDYYIDSIIEAGGQVYYRLGESIDHYPLKLFINPPKDYLKWAKICEHIILHYNYGWNNGRHYNIKFFEIWNEPDNANMWTGTHEEFFELYYVTSTYLKKKFPEILIGGYASSGFYARNRENPWDWFKTLLPYMDEFFTYITTKGERAPLDFFSWHCYQEYPEEIALHESYARELLHKYGYDNALSILDEFNNMYSLDHQPNENLNYMSELGASLIVAQRSTLDMLMYYDIRVTTKMNGLFFNDGYTTKKLGGFYAYKYFGKLLSLKESYESSYIKDHLYTLAAKDDSIKGIMISAYDFEGDTEITINGIDNYNSITITETTKEVVESTTNVNLENNKLYLNIKNNSVYYIEIK